VLCFTQWVKEATMSHASGGISNIKNINRL
jgi:hypothetical protein